MEGAPIRRLAAILCADVQGYSRLMGADEEATLRDLKASHEVIRRLVAEHRGRVVNAPGDSVLAEFAELDELGLDQLARRTRHEHLAAVSGCRDTGTQVDVLTHVALGPEMGCTSVKPHAYSDWSRL